MRFFHAVVSIYYVEHSWADFRNNNGYTRIYYWHVALIDTATAIFAKPVLYVYVILLNNQLFVQNVFDYPGNIEYENSVGE